LLESLPWCCLQAATSPCVTSRSDQMAFGWIASP
jgi:hypothetical protein